MSFTSRVLGIFVDPGEVFEEVARNAPCAANWLIPLMLSCWIGVICSPALAPGELSDAADPAKQHGRRAQQNARQFSSNAAAELKLGQGSALVAGSFAGAFWSAAMLWLIGRLALRQRIGYMKAVEVVGLTLPIVALGTVTSTLLALATGHPLATPSLALFLPTSDSLSRLHAVLSAVNIFHVWVALVLASGLAKLSQAPFAEAAFWTIGYWIALRLIFALLGG